MPFVNVRLVAGRDQATKDEMARKIVDAIAGTAGMPKESVWVAFEDVAPGDFYVGEKSVAESRKSKG